MPESPPASLSTAAAGFPFGMAPELTRLLELGPSHLLLATAELT
jgi:hypothetical protein